MGLKKKDDASTVSLPENYQEVLAQVKARVQAAQTRAVLAVNAELLALYLDLGRQLAEQSGAWGDRVVERLAADLRAAFPAMRGFSRSNLFYMRQVWLAWAGADQTVQQLVGQLPWGHHLVLVSKVPDLEVRLWYLKKAVSHGWSRPVLTLQIERQLHRREGRALTNFQQTLPPPDSDLAQQTLKDPYIFDFLTTGDDVRERQVEKELVDHVQRFLLELGAGFAFVGRQVHLEVEGEDYYIDLLFYHLKLRSYIVIELKAKGFRPADAGQLNFYLSAVDDLIRHPDDKPTIGLLLCKEKSRVKVEYALRGLNRPIGIASWETQLVERLPDELKGSLPTVEELERELGMEEMEE